MILPITNQEINQNKVASLPSRPNASVAFGGAGYSSAQLKAAFDRLPLLLAERYNALVGAIQAEGEESLLAQIPTGIPTPEGGTYMLGELLTHIKDGTFATYLKVGEGYLDLVLSTLAPLDSPAFLGSPTATTPALSDASERIATTAFVQEIVAKLQGGVELPEAAPSPEGGQAEPITVDQTYRPLSQNAQSGIAVAQAIRESLVQTESKPLYHHLLSFAFTGYPESVGTYGYKGCVAVEIINTQPTAYTQETINDLRGSFLASGHTYQPVSETPIPEYIVNSVQFTDEGVVLDVCYIFANHHSGPMTLAFSEWKVFSYDSFQDTVTVIPLEQTAIADQSTDEDATPAYVQAEAKAVADKVIATGTPDSLVLLMGTDIHMVNDSITNASILHMAQGMEQIRRYVTPDGVVLLGDYVYDSTPSSKEQGIEDMKRVRNFLTKATVGLPVMWLNGNHDTYNVSGDNRIADNTVYALVGSHNQGTTVDPDNVGRNYGYVDFEKQRIRVIYLNTTDINGGINSSNYISNIQGTWLVNTALDLSEKAEEEKWGVVVCSHFPIFAPSFADLLAVLTAYQNKASGTNYGASYDFSTAKAQLIATFHGHIHNFKVTTVNGIKCICIPNAYPNRQNPYATNPDFAEVDENGTAVYYHKTKDTAEDTSFNAVVIDRDSKTVHAIAYGAGYDRVIPYGEIQPTYTNQIPISTDASGAVYNGVGYKENTRLNSSAVEKEYSGICCTGFIPFAKQEDGYTWIYFQNCRIDATKDSNGYQEIAFYTADKTLIRKAYVGSIYAATPEICTVEGNYLTSIQLGEDAAFIRITGDYIGADSIITVNEPITP